MDEDLAPKARGKVTLKDAARASGKTAVTM